MKLISSINGEEVCLTKTYKRFLKLQEFPEKFTSFQFSTASIAFYPSYLLLFLDTSIWKEQIIVRKQDSDQTLPFGILDFFMFVILFRSTFKKNFSMSCCIK